MSVYRDHGPCTNLQCAERHEQLLASGHWKTIAKIAIGVALLLLATHLSPRSVEGALERALDPAPTAEVTPEEPRQVDAAIDELPDPPITQLLFGRTPALVHCRYCGTYSESACWVKRWPLYEGPFHLVVFDGFAY